MGATVIHGDKANHPKFHRIAALAGVAVVLNLPSRSFSVTIFTGPQVARVYCLAADTAANARYITIPASSVVTIPMDFDYLALLGGVAAEVGVITMHKMDVALSETY